MILNFVMDNNTILKIVEAHRHLGVTLSSSNKWTVHINAIIQSSAKPKKVQVGKDQEKAQSEKDSHSQKPRWEKNKLTIRYLYHENIS